MAVTETSAAPKRHARSEPRDRGRIACLPLYPPLELIDSFGLLPVVPWNLGNRHALSEASNRHLQNYTCSVARRVVEFFATEEQERNDLEAVMFYNACDTLRNLPEIVEKVLEENKRSGIPFLRLHVPAAWNDTEASAKYLDEEINSLVEKLERLTGKPFSPAAFRRSAASYARMRRIALEGAALVREGSIAYADYSALLADSALLPAEDGASSLERLIAGSQKSGASGGIPVMLSGILPPPREAAEFIEGAGLRVAANDIAAERRSLDNFPGLTDDPCAYYADFYFNHHPCTTLLYTAPRRVEHIEKKIDESGTKGLIFLGEKFCEYEYFEIVHLEKRLKERGIPTLKLEFSPEDGGSFASVKTRVEAFAEMLGG